VRRNILITTTSFQDTPGRHKELLDPTDFSIDYLRGPLKKEDLIPIIGNYDGIICGDDEISREVVQAASVGKLRIISKYGIGLDKIDLVAAKEFRIPVTNCPGVNHVTVAEHVFALLLSFKKNIVEETNYVRQQKWTRMIGREIYGQKLGIMGLGHIGKEVAKRAQTFGLEILAFDKNIDVEFTKKHNIECFSDVDTFLSKCDIISLNLALNKGTHGIINERNLKCLKKGVVIINTARANLIELKNIVLGLEENIIGGYLTDVLENEPIIKNHPLLKFDNVIITPHIGSRTYESVARQGTMAVENLLKHINS